MQPRRWAERFRNASQVGFLAIVLVLITGLAYQAVDLARTHRAVAERTLRDRAAMAAWEIARQSEHRLLIPTVASLSRPANTLIHSRRRDSIAGGSMRLKGPGSEEPLWSFSLDLRSDALVVQSGTMRPAEAPRWIADTVRARAGPRAMHLPGAAIPEATPRSGVLMVAPGNGGPAPGRAVGAHPLSYGLVVAPRGGTPTLVAYVVEMDSLARPRKARGEAVVPQAFLAAALGGVMGTARLLPPDLLPGVPADSVFAVRVLDPAGRELYRSPMPFDSSTAGEARLSGHLGALVIQVSVRPGLADRLVIGGLPRSRLPMLIGLFLLTFALLVVGIVQMRRQQELARLRADFVAGVSHELRTPLAQIRLFADLLHSGVIESESERRSFARIIDEEARRLSQLVGNVLSFSQLAQAGVVMQRDAVDVGEEVREAVRAYEPLAHVRRARFEVSAVPGAVAFANRAALRQILLNLFDNAVKYGPEAQTVRVRTCPDGRVARIEVEDEGPGIPSRDRRRIFEPYYRLPRDQETGMGGSGIGLAVLHELVARHGGSVRVDDGATGGARFVVELPTAPARPHGRKRPAVPRGPAR